MDLKEGTFDRDKIYQLEKDLSCLAFSREIIMEDRFMAQIYLSAILGKRFNQYPLASELINKYKQTKHIFE